MLGDGLPNSGTQGSYFRYQFGVLKLLQDIDDQMALLVAALPGVDYEMRTTHYKANTNGAGYSTGDFISRVDIINAATGVIASTLWFNETTGLSIAAPPIGNLDPYNPPNNIGIQNWLGATTPTVGQKTMAASLPVVIASDQTAIPVSGTVAVTTIIPGTAATNLGKAEDAATASGDTGVGMLLKRSDTAAAQTDTDGDYTLPTANQYGAVRMNINRTFQVTDANDILKAEDAVHGSGDAGVMALAVANEAQVNFAADGDYVPLGTDRTGAQYSLLKAGSAIIGKVGIDQTTPGTTNGVSLAQLGANTIATGNGASSTGVVRVAQVNDGTGRLATLDTLTSGNVGGFTTLVQSTIVMSTAGAYATGDYMGTTTSPQSFASAVRVSGGTGIIKSILISDKITTANVTMELWIIDRTFVAPSDNAAWNLSDSDMLFVQAVIPISVANWFASSVGQVYFDGTLSYPIKSNGTTLFYALIARGTTPSFTSSDLTVTLGILQD